MPKLSQRENGFTIIELLLAIIVLGVVGASISSMFASIQRSQLGTRHLETATRAAQSQVESLRNTDYQSLTPGEEVDFTDELPTTLPSSRQGTVFVSEPAPGLRRVDVEVEYNYSGNTRSVELSTTIGVIGITQ